MHEIGGGFEQSQTLALLLAKLDETRIGFDGPICQVAGEIVDRLLMPARAEENDLNPRGGPFALGDKTARRIERDERNRVDGTAGACEEHVEDWKSAVELVLGEVDLHVLRDEETPAQHRIERLAEIG